MSDAMNLMDDALSYVYSAALRAAAELHLADRLPSTLTELAAMTGAHPAALDRLLRVLVARGIVAETHPGTFTLTHRAEPLRSDHATTVHDAILAHTDPAIWNSAGDLHHAVTTGKPSFDHLYGTSLFTWFANHPEEGDRFDRGMTDVTRIENQPAIDTIQLPGTGTVVDVGGGTGGLLLAALRTNPNLYGVLYDQQHVTSQHVLDSPTTTGRWEVHNGDFFDNVPVGDVYLLKRILHDWNDDQALRILHNCVTAARPGARIIAIDPIIPSHNEPHHAKLLDLVLMAIVPGRERTADQIKSLFSAASLHTQCITAVPGTAMSVVEASPLDTTQTEPSDWQSPGTAET